MASSVESIVAPSSSRGRDMASETKSEKSGAKPCAMKRAWPIRGAAPRQEGGPTRRDGSEGRAGKVRSEAGPGEVRSDKGPGE
eukprot:5699190-Pleurochrysis_carterae.AAC.1